MSKYTLPMTNDCHCLGELLDGHIMPIYRAKYDMLYTVHSYAHVHLAACYGCQKQLFRLTGETMSMSITCQTMESQSTLFVVATSGRMHGMECQQVETCIGARD